MRVRVGLVLRVFVAEYDGVRVCVADDVCVRVGDILLERDGV